MSFSTSRLAAGFTLEDVCRDFRVSPDTARDWEEGRAQPPGHVARSLDVIGGYAADAGPSLAIAAPAVQDTAVRARPASRPATSKTADIVATGTAPSSLIRSKRRVADHGEVFTPSWLVEKMLDLVKGESERIDARFLEPACGSGNFLVPILKRKLAAVEAKYGRTPFEKRHYALVALSCCYGIELLADNIAECRANMLEVFATCLGVSEGDDLYRTASHMLSVNLVHGDAMTMLAADGGHIMIVEWGYLGKGKFQRRDFRLDVLTGQAKLFESTPMFRHKGAELAERGVFTPVGEHPPMRVRELAALDRAGA